MRPAVEHSFTAFTSPLEGVTNFAYLDIKGLVTTAIGCLVDPVEAFLGLPWIRKGTGLPAGIDEQAAEWHRVKALTALAPHGGGAFKSSAQLLLTIAGVEALVQRRLGLDDDYLNDIFPLYYQWPADAQLGLLSMAWAMGPAFHFPLFAADSTRWDFAAAAGPLGDADKDPSKRGDAWMENNYLPGKNPANPGLHARNLANKVLFQNAAVVMKTDVFSGAGATPLNRDTLYWPHVLA